ncbi:hypothetical protein [Streptomyces sp. TLI_171]|uniref:hypothetical protein n=1 Tax=Streptomyces sp. TLI_171 TaxID=1938859 RepID=UPI000C175707|nr:hypothetical protein [Streptomyces sp. TLI_171]RKE20791.1 hypothetical protein BX266_4164 [Streptomyces sp. TLI_171]
MPSGPPYTITVLTDDAEATSSAGFGIARLLAQLPGEWVGDFTVDGGRADLRLNAPDPVAARQAVQAALAQPALREWRLADH